MAVGRALEGGCPPEWLPYGDNGWKEAVTCYPASCSVRRLLRPAVSSTSASALTDLPDLLRAWGGAGMIETNCSPCEQIARKRGRNQRLHRHSVGYRHGQNLRGRPRRARLRGRSFRKGIHAQSLPSPRRPWFDREKVFDRWALTTGRTSPSPHHSTNRRNAGRRSRWANVKPSGRCPNTCRSAASSSSKRGAMCSAPVPARSTTGPKVGGTASPRFTASSGGRTIDLRVLRRGVPARGT